MKLIMKKWGCTIGFLMVMLFSISAQTKTPSEMAQVRSQYYEVSSDGGRS
jgi:hypothetical protein